VSSSIADLRELVLGFSNSRGWHKEPKDLAMSVAVEAAEIMEHYQWVKTGERAEQPDEVALECADVLWYLLRLADAEGIDLEQALRRKHAINATRFAPKAP
jgi:dCTP diphosphatase